MEQLVALVRLLESRQVLQIEQANVLVWEAVEMALSFR